MRATSRGLTVIEIVIGAALSSLLLGALLRFLVAGHPIARVTYLQLQSTETARLQLGRLSESLREVRYSDAGSYPLVELEPMRLVFYANIDNDPVVERVRYELTGTHLVRGVIEPTGDPPTYPVAAEVSATVASSLRNDVLPLFTYYSGAYPEEATVLSTATRTQVKYIQLQLIIDADPAVDPAPVSVVSQVQLRNLKNNLGQTLP